ncbi:MAG: ABC transporter permease [Acidimicrobiales bacterium]|nr:ABC transporter permease [Acidimicrobiales bacterium]
MPDDQNPAAKVESVPTDPADRVQEIHPLEDQAAETGARTPRDLGEDALPPAPDDDPAVRRKPLAIAYWLAVGWVVLVLAAAVFADLLPLPDPIESDFTVLAQPPSLDHPLGTDEVGRDILSRSVFGARVSLVVGISSVLLGLVIGGLFGLGAGYLRGRTERVIMTMTDALLALPALVLLLTIAAVLGQSLRNIVLGLAILSIPTFIRLTRASTLVVSQREFVMASRSYGSRAVRVMLREILPNVVPPVAAYSFIIIGVVIVAEGSLSFLGLGVPPPTPSWGGMIAGGRISLTETPHIALSPSLVMFLTVLSFNFIGERLRKKFDVKESSL